MRRCAICDYAEGVGSPLHGIPADRRKVLWRETHHEYQCDICANEIKQTVLEQEVNDALKEHAKDVQPIDPYDTDCEVPAALSQSKMPF